MTWSAFCQQQSTSGQEVVLKRLHSGFEVFTTRWLLLLGKTSTGKKRFQSGIARIRGGVYSCPDFLAPFFFQVLVLKVAFFYSNFTVIVCFFSHFCHNYHQNYHNYHHNYHCNLHYQHQIVFWSYAVIQIIRQQLNGSWWLFWQTLMKFWSRWDAEKN